MRPEALFVDCYGTLVDGDRPAIRAAVQAVALRTGLDADTVDRAWWERFRGLCAERTGASFGTQRDLEIEAMSDVLRHADRALPQGEVADLLEPLFLYWRTAEPLADAVDFLQHWTGCPVFVVSNTDRADLDRVLPGLPAVAGVITSEDARAYKPDPIVFRHALSTIGVPPDRVIHVGDSWASDVLGASAAGIRAVWLDRSGVPLTEPGPPAAGRVGTLARLARCIAALPDQPGWD